MIEGFTRVVETLSRLCGFLAAILLVMATAVLCQMVLVRYLLHAASYWQTEFVTYALIGITFVGAPYVLMGGGHLGVDLVSRLPAGRARFPLALGVNLLAVACCITIAALGAGAWYDAWTQGQRSETLWAVPLWIPYLAMPVGFGILSLQYVANILAVSTGGRAPFGRPGPEPGD